MPVAVSAVLALGASSCSNELDLAITDEQTTVELDYTGLLAKIYGNLTLTGTTGGSGNPDMSQFDEGNSSFYRRIFEANELCSDECIWTWQNDDGIPELTNISWNSSHGYNELTYYRIMYNVTLCTYYLDATEGTTDAQVLQNRAEVRFIRALHYFHFIDLYGKAPFKEHILTASGEMITDLPTEMSRVDAFNYVVSELKAINGDTSDSKEQLLDFAGDDDNYGRADKVAANMLLARLYLNAEVYTGTAQWDKAVEYATRVIGSQYVLNETPYNGRTAYEQLFMGDNGENPNARQEIIFPIRCDGATSRSYGGSLYTIASTTGNGTPAQGLYSSDSQWTCNRARQALVNKFFTTPTLIPMGYEEGTMENVRSVAGDERAMFFAGAENADGKNQRTYETEEKTSFPAGLGILKWNNEYATGGTPSDVAFSDTDVPLMRVAEAYLTRAEANFRMGASNDVVLADLNKIRNRAHASELTATQLSALTICDEWCREFYFEGRRRSDLIRFGYFTTGSYTWDWKGGAYEGKGVSSIYKLYPIPYNELSSNKNMTQNPGY